MPKDDRLLLRFCRTMVYTKRTWHIGCRGGRAGSRAVAAGLAPRGGVGNRERTSSSRTRSLRNSSRGSANVSREESSQNTPIDYSTYDPSEEPSEEYTPRTPTREDLNDTIENLNNENAKLKKELSEVQEEKDKTEGWLNNLQVEHANLGLELNKVLKENDELWGNNHDMAWKCVELEWEKRIVARPWRMRLRDRARYFRGAASEYIGLIKGYLSSWAHQYHHGPNMEFIWKYRPENTYEEFVKITHYPMDMP